MGEARSVNVKKTTTTISRIGSTLKYRGKSVKSGNIVLRKTRGVLFLLLYLCFVSFFYLFVSFVSLPGDDVLYWLLFLSVSFVCFPCFWSGLVLPIL